MNYEEIVNKFIVKIPLKLTEYDLSKVFENNLNLIIYLYDYKIFVNKNIIIKKYNFDDNFLDDFEILYEMNLNNIILKYFIKLCIHERDYSKILQILNLETSQLELIKNDDIIEILFFIKDNLNVNFNCSQIIFCEIIDRLIRSYKLDDEFKLITKNINIFESIFFKSSDMINKIVNILNLQNVINEYLKLNSEKINQMDVSEESKMTYYSIITHSNWIEELEYGNFMGLLLSICPKDINADGYNMDFIPINNISNTVISFTEFLEANELRDKYNKWENILSGNGVGDGNCILPLYINKYHWDIAKYYFELNLGLIFNKNGLNYLHSYKNIYKNVLFKMINKTFSDDNYNSDKWLNLFFSVYRTCVEIFTNESNLLDKFNNSNLYRIECNINDIIFQYLISEKENKSTEKYIFEELLRRTFKTIYKDINELDNLYWFNEDSALNYYKENTNLFNENNYFEWIGKLQKNKIFSDKLTLMHGIIMTKKIKNSIKDFDDNYGCLDSETLKKVKSYVKENKINPENYKLIGIMNEKFTSHINFTKEKLFTINSIKNLNLVNDEELKSLLIQTLLQRVNKSRRNAILNNKYENPFQINNIIINAGQLIAHRFLKNYYNLYENDKYIKVLNSLEEEKITSFCESLINNTISIKKYVIMNKSYINENIRELILNNLS